MAKSSSITPTDSDLEGMVNEILSDFDGSLTTTVSTHTGQSNYATIIYPGQIATGQNIKITAGNSGPGYTTTTRGSGGWVGTAGTSFDPVSYPCRFCGKNKIYGLIKKGEKAQLCEDCFRDLIVEKIVKEAIPDLPEYCKECFSHITACICPKKQAMDKLKS